MQINFEAASPIYEQIITQIKKKIAREELEPGVKLPSQRELARELEVNPNTVQRSYREMEARQLVETKRGRGTFITDKREVVDQVKQEMVDKIIEKFWREMKSLGYAEQEIIQAVEDQVTQWKETNGGES